MMWKTNQFQVTIGGRSSRDAIGMLVRGEILAPRVTIDDCKGMECSNGCPDKPKLPQLV